MNCQYCGNELTKRHQLKFCSLACMHASQRETRKAESESKRKRICQQCSKEFIMPYASGNANRGEIKAGLYCSRKCRWEHDKKNPIRSKKVKNCRICGKETPSPRMFYCSDECRKEKARRYERNKNKLKKSIIERICKECGRVFVSEYGNKRKLYCSDQCLARSARRRKRQKERARLRCVKVETVNAMDVFIRDGWKCQLCGAKLKRTYRGTFKDRAP